MNKDEIIEIVRGKFDGLVQSKNWGEVGLFYNPEHIFSKGIYLLTFKEKDGANDKASNVDREGVYRLNLGISRATFVEMFGALPKRPKAGRTIQMPYNFAQLNTIMPHPVYGWMSWIGVLNPTRETFEKLLPLIEKGYNLALEKYQKKVNAHDQKVKRGLKPSKR